MVRPITMGSGEVYHTNKPIIHFGSPAGTQFEEDDAEPNE